MLEVFTLPNGASSPARVHKTNRCAFFLPAPACKFQGLSRQFAIALTATATLGNRNLLIGVGFDDYVSKPFTADQLLERLRDRGQAAVLGNAVDPATLVQAHIADAKRARR